MDVLYLLIPLSAVLVLAIIGVFGWAVHHGQFDDIEREGERILGTDNATVDVDQGGAAAATEEWTTEPLSRPRDPVHGPRQSKPVNASTDTPPNPA